MKNRKVREFLQQTIIKVGAIAIASALVLTSSSWSGIFKGETQFVSEAELPVFADPEGSISAPDSETPGAGAPKVTKTTKTNKTTKKVKLKEKSKKTYTKKSSPQKKTTTTKKVTDTETTTVTTEVITSLTSKFTKGSNINKQTTTVKTITTTTVQANQPAADDGVMVVDAGQGSAVQTVASTQAAAQASASGPISISTAAPRVDSRVSSAYEKLGFTIGVDPSVNYSGVFDARSRSITLKKTGDTVYHEIGHFVAFIAGNVDKASAFQQVFNQEKDKYTLYNKAYVCQNSSEYFAESFKNYTMDPNSLRATRPLTYSAIEAALNNITDAQVARVQAVYRAVWGA